MYNQNPEKECWLLISPEDPDQTFLVNLPKKGSAKDAIEYALERELGGELEIVTGSQDDGFISITWGQPCGDSLDFDCHKISSLKLICWDGE